MSLIQAEHIMNTDPGHARVGFDPKYEHGSAFIHGQYCAIDAAAIPIVDCGFMHADAAYDVVSASKGLIFRLEDHQDRFEQSCKSFRLCNPYSRGETAEILTNLVVLAGEVRGPDGKPRDPQAHGFAVPDTMAPEILLVRAVPVSDAAAGTSWLAGDGTTPLSGALPDMTPRSGPWRFAALIIDRSDHLRYRLEPWRVSLRCDDRLVYQCRNDSLAWSRNRQQRLEFRRGPHGQERWLWFDPARNRQCLRGMDR